LGGEKRRVDFHGGSARKVVAQVPVEEVQVDVASDFGLRFSSVILVFDFGLQFSSVILVFNFGLRFSSVIPFVGRERESAETAGERERERERESWVDEGERREESFFH
jgi:hypothetical protein